MVTWLAKRVRFHYVYELISILVCIFWYHYCIHNLYSFLKLLCIPLCWTTKYYIFSSLLQLTRSKNISITSLEFEGWEPGWNSCPKHYRNMKKDAILWYYLLLWQGANGHSLTHLTCQVVWVSLQGHS